MRTPKRSAVATLLVRRGASAQELYWSRFEVPFHSGESVLDGLRRVRAESDPSLAFRYSCINANACKECMIMIDGSVAYACTARLEAREMRLEPLPTKAHVRDLVAEIAPPDERLPRSGRVAE
jgi:succinate dehydrogenase/fumarate reductase-like Fe-S protein